MAGKKILGITDFGSLRGKTVIVRVDLNSPLEGGKVREGPRFRAHAETVKLLAGKGAKVVVLAHQGRKGDDDFTPLKQHASILSKLLGIKVSFTPDPEVVGPKTLAAVKALKAGGVMLLDNVRYADDETKDGTPEDHAKGKVVSALAPLADLFVFDAFSVGHRAQATVVGFCAVLPSAAGPVMVRELEGALKAREHAEHPNVYLLGGAKPDDVVKLMQYALEKGIVDKVLTSGVIGELCLLARGNKFSAVKQKELDDNGFTKLLPVVREMVQKHNEHIETPFDFAVEEDGQRKIVTLTHLPTIDKPIYDIGIKTSNRYSKVVRAAKTVYVKGPCGKYEEKPFQDGTRAVFTAIADSGAFTLVGGGHTLAAFEKFGIPASRLSHVSLAGGALLEMMQGKELPAVTALEAAAGKFGAKFR